MTQPLNESKTESPKANGIGSKFRRAAQFSIQNPIRTNQFVFFSLVAIIILQNFETTSIDVLFWSITSLPLLVLIFLSMVVGAVAWELLRRLKR